MFRTRINLWLPLIILAVALPATTAYLYYHATKDPNLRPLGVTKEELADNNADGGTGAINVRVDWGMNSTLTMSQAEVRQALSRSLDVFDADFWFTFETVPGNAVQVSLAVGGNRFGPYPIYQTSTGIRSAVTVQQLIRNQEGVAAQ